LPGIYKNQNNHEGEEKQKRNQKFKVKGIFFPFFIFAQHFLSFPKKEPVLRKKLFCFAKAFTKLLRKGLRGKEWEKNKS